MNGAWAVSWIVVAAVLFVVETVTYQLVCIWFALGAVLAMIAAWLGAPVWLQFLVFLAASLVVLYFGRPLLKKKLKVKKSATNADRVIGQVGVVKEEINNELQTGRVSANGFDWTARSAGGEIVPAGSRVVAERIDGVKLIVRPLEAAACAETEKE